MKPRDKKVCLAIMGYGWQAIRDRLARICCRCPAAFINASLPRQSLGTVIGFCLCSTPVGKLTKKHSRSTEILNHCKTDVILCVQC